MQQLLHTQYTATFFGTLHTAAQICAIHAHVE